MNCLNCGTENNITNLQCSNCNHILVPKDELKENLDNQVEKSEAELKEEKFQLRIATVRFNLYVISGLFFVYLILHFTMFETIDLINYVYKKSTWYNIILSIVFLISARLIQKKPREVLYTSTLIYVVLLANNHFKVIPEVFVSFFIPIVNIFIHIGIMMSFIKAILTLEKKQEKRDSEILDT